MKRLCIFIFAEKIILAILLLFLYYMTVLSENVLFFIVLFVLSENVVLCFVWTPGRVADVLHQLMGILIKSNHITISI